MQSGESSARSTQRGPSGPTRPGGQKKLGRWAPRLPRTSDLRDTFLHRRLGERLFDPRLWRFRREDVAAGLALGVFVALTPTMGIQMAISVVLAFFLRVNIPVAVVACWITNPVTAPAIYFSQYKLGVLLTGMGSAEVGPGSEDLFDQGLSVLIPLGVGSGISGLFFGALSYVLVMKLWGRIKHLFDRDDEPESVPGRREPGEGDQAPR